MNERIVRKRMHGLYLSRSCGDLVALSRELLGLHSWFYRNVPFSALIRGADISGWRTALTKTWLYRGTLHGISFEDLPRLLALHTDETYLYRYFGEAEVKSFADEVVRHMEDGVFSRKEFRKIFAGEYEPAFLDNMFSPWGGVFVLLARQGRVAFRDMASRDFDLIDAEPTQTREEVLPELLHDYLAAYGPATLADAAWFFGFWKEDARKLRALAMDAYGEFELNGVRYYECEDARDMADIPELTLLSGFDPLLASYADRCGVIPDEHKAKVILKSGICNPTVAVDGRVAGIWNIKKDEPVVEFFEPQPPRLVREAFERADAIRQRVRL